MPRTSRGARWAGRLLVASLALTGCRQAPAYNGKSLACKADKDCPDNMRCSKGVCLFNSPPQVAPMDALQVIVGTAFTVTATATDADGDPLTFTWTQKQGPTLLAQPLADATLSLVPTELGTYVFEVVANDGRADSVAQQLTVVVGNTPPTIAPMDLVQVKVDTPVDETAVATDPDAGQTVTITWQQVSGPDAGLGVVNGAELTFTPQALGLYTFSVVANDGFTDGDPQTFDVLVAPELNVIYVSDAADPSVTDCGSFDAPCATLDDGVAAAAAASPPIDTILVAANTAGAVYHTCLNLSGSQVIRGGFDPTTWEYQPNLLRQNTRVECDQDTGHHLAGTVQVQDLVLASSDTSPSDTSPSGPFVPTVVIDGGTPKLTNVDVEAAACGSSCTAGGVGIEGASPILHGVEVRAQPAGFTTLGSLYGIVAWGGAPVIEGTASSGTARTPNDGERGGVTLDAPVNGSAAGIVLLESDATITGMTVTGGLGANLVGIEMLGGTATVTDSYVDITGFGTLSSAGISAGSCGSNCTCPPDQSTCSSMLSGGTEPLLTASDNTVILRSAAGTDGQVPCGGFGIVVDSQRSGQTLQNNTVQVVNAFSLAMGIYSVTPMSDAAADTLQDNSISIDDGRGEHLCVLLGLGLSSDFQQGLLGMIVSGQNVAATGNDITVGSHDANSVGLVVLDAQGSEVSGNDVLVGAGTGSGVQGAKALGVLVGPSEAPSEMARNQFDIGADTADGTALSVLQASPGADQWVIANNFLFGGRGIHGTGLSITALGGGPSSPWPKFVHNTIDGGGDPTSSLTSRAVETKAPINDAGTLENNLLDAGDAQGRRYVFDNQGAGLFAPMAGNEAQFVGNATGPAPSFVVAPVSSSSGLIGPSSGQAYWNVLMQGAGQLVSMTDAGGRLVEAPPQPLPGVPLFAWSGVKDGQPAVVAVLDGQVAVSSLANGTAGRLTEFSLQDAAGQTHHPMVQGSTIAIGDMDGAPPADLVFLEAGANAGDPNTAWVMTGDGTQGFGAPTQLTGLANPVAVAQSTNGRNVFVVDEQPNATPPVATLDVYPAAASGGGAIDITSMLPNGAASVIQMARLVSFQDEAVGSTRYDDLLAIADDQVGTVFNVRNPGTRQQVGFATGNDPCTAGGSATNGTPVDVAGGQFNPAVGTAVPVLLVRCSAGTIELYAYNSIAAPPDWSYLTEQTDTASAMAWFSDSNELMTVSPANESVTLYRITKGTGYAFNVAASYTPPTDIAMRNSAADYEGDFSFSGAPSGISLAGTGTTTVCGLQRRAVGSGYDLHLDPANPGSCQNGGADLSSTGDTRTDDIDGIGTRTDGQPDIGADELQP